MDAREAQNYVFAMKTYSAKEVATVACQLHPTMVTAGHEQRDILKEIVRRCSNKYSVDAVQPWDIVLQKLYDNRFSELTTSGKLVDKRYEVVPPPPSDERFQDRVATSRGAREVISASNVSVDPEYWNHRAGFGSKVQPYDHSPVASPKKSPQTVLDVCSIWQEGRLY